MLGRSYNGWYGCLLNSKVWVRVPGGPLNSGMHARITSIIVKHLSNYLSRLFGEVVQWIAHDSTKVEIRVQIPAALLVCLMSVMDSTSAFEAFRNRSIRLLDIAD